MITEEQSIVGAQSAKGISQKLQANTQKTKNWITHVDINKFSMNGSPKEVSDKDIIVPLRSTMDKDVNIFPCVIMCKKA